MDHGHSGMCVCSEMYVGHGSGIGDGMIVEFSGCLSGFESRVSIEN